MGASTPPAGPLRKTRVKRVTLADVAARAGVSVATASVAITGRPSGNCRVSAPVAERIRVVARELKYRPNLQARNLSTQRTRMIAVVVKRAAWQHALFYVSGIQRVLRQRGYAESVMLHPENTADAERQHLELCLERGVEGIIALPLIDPAGRANADLYNRLHDEEHVPVVQIAIALPGCIAPGVTMDASGGIAHTVTLLHAMGHRRIAMATIPGYADPLERPHPNRYAQLCYDGYRSAMAGLGLEERVFCATVAELPDWSSQYDCSVPLAAAIAQAPAADRPTAVIGFSEFAAAGLLAGFGEIGLRVPDDISVVGGSEAPLCRMLRPPLTTLDVPFERIGAAAAEMLLGMIDGAPGISHSFPPALNMRESVRAI